jgi:hypothetical protein
MKVQKGCWGSEEAPPWAVGEARCVQPVTHREEEPTGVMASVSLLPLRLLAGVSGGGPGHQPGSRVDTEQGRARTQGYLGLCATVSDYCQ